MSLASRYKIKFPCGSWACPCSDKFFGGNRVHVHVYRTDGHTYAEKHRCDCSLWLGPEGKAPWDRDSNRRVLVTHIRHCRCSGCSAAWVARRSTSSGSFQRSWKLLRQHLTPRQRRMLDTHLYFDLIDAYRRMWRLDATRTSGNAFLFTGVTPWGVTPWDAKGRLPFARYWRCVCIVPGISELPTGDHLLSQVLMLKTDPKSFSAIAEFAGSYDGNALYQPNGDNHGSVYQHPALWRPWSGE